jgi:hypothetical protein
MTRSTSSSGRSGNGGGGGLFGCFKSPPVVEHGLAEEEAAITPVPPNVHAAVGGANGSSSSSVLSRSWMGLSWHADVDCLAAYPVHGEQLARSSFTPAGREEAVPDQRRRGDYTIHGGHVRAAAAAAV